MSQFFNDCLPIRCIIDGNLSTSLLKLQKRISIQSNSRSHTIRTSLYSKTLENIKDTILCSSFRIKIKYKLYGDLKSLSYSGTTTTTNIHIPSFLPHAWCFSEIHIILRLKFNNSKGKWKSISFYKFLVLFC